MTHRTANPAASRGLQAILISVIWLGAVFLVTDTSLADHEVDPERETTLTLEIEEKRWWLVRWEDDQVDCEVYSDQDGLPTRQELWHYCGDELFEAWMQTPPCLVGGEGNDPSTCKGYYLHLVGSRTVEREVVVELPTPKVWISLIGCEPVQLSHRCLAPPSLFFSAEEPLPNERISAIHVEIEGERLTCEAAKCEISLRDYLGDRVEVEFWAESTFGDESEHYLAIVRTILLESELETHQNLWQVDVLSDRWMGRPLAACSASWEAFPPVGEAPEWLSSPTSVLDLATDEPMELLAGRLLSWGLVDASACPFGGLLLDGTASRCGIEHSREAVGEWQNRFDRRIYDVAQEAEVPARVIKRLFAQETQFWPGGFPNLQEYGLGAMVPEGGDVLLLWNISFYDDFCPLVLSGEACEARYHELDAASQQLLRGALALQADVSCPSCPGRVDLNKAEQSVDLFAKILLAGCDQVGQLVFSSARLSPGMVVSYEDLWRFVLANYQSGPGCLSKSLDRIQKAGLPLNWLNLRADLADSQGCSTAVRYVEAISGRDG